MYQNGHHLSFTKIKFGCYIINFNHSLINEYIVNYQVAVANAITTDVYCLLL